MRLARVRTTWAVRDGRAVRSGRFLDEWVDDVVTQVVHIVNPSAVWLFGSVARGHDDSDSDIDLLVVLADYDPSQSLASDQIRRPSVVGADRLALVSGLTSGRGRASATEWLLPDPSRSTPSSAGL